MTPGARIAAAIEVLEIFEASRTPVDKLLKEWARRSRFAGSKDRAAVAELVYVVLRRRSEFAAIQKDESPAALVQSALIVLERASLETIDGLFSGEGYSPPPLTIADRRRLREAIDQGPPAERPLNFPDWVIEKFRAQFGADADDEMSAFDERAPLDLRANTLMRSRAQVQTELAQAGVECEPTNISPRGLRITPPAPGQKPVNLKPLKPFQDGWVEVQDEGSQILTLLAGAKPGDQVVDFCAGGGGKTLALAAEMKNSGQIHALDVDRKRLAAIKPRLERAHVRNAQLKAITRDADSSDRSLASLEGKADLVFVDAPCSGSGTWRRRPDGRWLLTPEQLAAYADLQFDVLSRAAKLVKLGGRLFYATCSLFDEENEAPCARFLEAHKGFQSTELAPTSLEPGVNWRTTRLGVLLSPARTGTDGFFAAQMERTG